MKTLLLFAILSSFNYCAYAQQVNIPQSFKICAKSSPNLATCVKDSIETLRPKLRTGDFGNGFKIDGIEPMVIDDILLERGRGFYFKLLNIKAYKVSNFHIEKIRVNADNFNVDVILDIPNVEAEGDYKINLVLGVIPFTGEGKFKCLIETMKIRLKLHTAKYIKNGVEYIKFINVDTKVKLGKFTIKLQNLFKDKLLADVGDTIINENLPSFLPEIEPKIEESVSRISFKSSNQIVQKIPFKYLLTQK